MQYGLGFFPTAYAIQPDDLARLAEERDFEGLYFAEHTHIPASRRTPWRGGEDLPQVYWHAYDPFVALTAAAQATTRLKVGTGVCLVIERDPIITAKQVATLDQLSHGRFVFGIGGGWNREEMENHGTNPKMRFRILRERVLAMKEIWTKEEAEFHGEFVEFDKIWSHPKTVQQPHPPILMGGDGPTTFDRVIEFCDGWAPLIAGPEGGLNLAEKISTLRRRADEAGRDSKSISVHLHVNFVLPDRDYIERQEEAGVDQLVFPLPSAERDAIVPVLDRYAELMR